MSETRRLAVLRAIIEDYVKTQDPVGSKALGERHNLGVSSATIRNDMAVLEEEGLIAQPHTSAGRIPTDKGYREFVDRIASVKPLSAAERRAIATLIKDPVDIDSIVEQTVRALAQLTQQVALVQYPSLSTDTVRHLDVVPLTEHRLLVVLITDTGRVEQRPVTLPDGYVAADLLTFRDQLLARIVGQPIHEAATHVEMFLGGLPQTEHTTWQPIGVAVTEALGHGLEERIVMAGTAHLTRSNLDPWQLGPILEILEEQVVLLRLVSDMAEDPDRGVSVQIGHENDHAHLASSSVVSSTYSNGQQSARLAVLGPTRMDYPTTMAAVRAVARYVSRIITPETPAS